MFKRIISSLLALQCGLIIPFFVGNHKSLCSVLFSASKEFSLLDASQQKFNKNTAISLINTIKTSRNSVISKYYQRPTFRNEQGWNRTANSRSGWIQDLRKKFGFVAGRVFGTHVTTQHHAVLLQQPSSLIILSHCLEDTFTADLTKY